MSKKKGSKKKHTNDQEAPGHSTSAKNVAPPSQPAPAGPQVLEPPTNGENAAPKNQPEPAAPQLSPAEALLLRMDRVQYAKDYALSIIESDNKILAYLDALVKQSEKAYRASILNHYGLFVVATVMLLSGLSVYLIKNVQLYQQILSIICILAGTLLYFFAFFRQPLRNIRDTMSVTVRLNVLYLAYLRQISQIDMAIKQQATSTTGLTADELVKYSAMIQDIMAQAIESIDELDAKGQ